MKNIHEFCKVYFFKELPQVRRFILRICGKKNKNGFFAELFLKASKMKTIYFVWHK